MLLSCRVEKINNAKGEEKEEALLLQFTTLASTTMPRHAAAATLSVSASANNNNNNNELLLKEVQRSRSWATAAAPSLFCLSRSPHRHEHKSFQCISSNTFLHSSRSPPPLCAGQIHLKLACVKESKSDDRRFTIYTEIESLRLKADTKDDKLAWVAALRSVKDLLLNNEGIHQEDDEEEHNAVVNLSHSEAQEKARGRTSQ